MKDFPSDYMKAFRENIEDFIFYPKFVFKNFIYDADILYNNYPFARGVESKFKTNQYEENIVLNSFGYRCEEFIEQHDYLHVLFTGCSVTYGNGLLLDEIWSKILYDNINIETKCSGYFNLAVPGTSIPNQIIDIFKYCKTYGNPKYIFFNMPDKFRFYAVSKSSHNIVGSLYDGECVELMDLITYQYYFMLDQYCKSNNINLYSFTWSYPENFYLDPKKWNNNRYIQNKFKLFNSFIDIKMNDLVEYIHKYKKNNKNDKYSETARDNDHFGTAYHKYWADKMFIKYLENQ